MLNRIATVILTSVILLIPFQACPAKELPARYWPAWRGPQSAGSAASGSYAAEWNASENLLWKVELPGVGRSTPIVWGDHIILTCPDNGQDVILDYHWSGKLRWKTAAGKERRGRHQNGSGSNPSAVTDGTYVFAYFKSGNLAGLNLDGKLLWKTNLQERFARDTLYWDIGTSPVLTEKHVVMTAMHEGESYLAAFDKKSGDLAWKVSRNYKCPVEGDHSYTTPIVIEHRGSQAILVWGAERLTAHGAADGKILWSCRGFNPESKPNWVTVASPVIVDNTVVVPYGRGARLAGIKLGGSGDVTGTHRLWTHKDKGSFVPTPVALGGKVYVLRDKGEVLCIEAKSGETIWSQKLPRHRGKYYASPVLAGGKLYATLEGGTITVVKLKADGFDVLSENDMGERMIASPVPVDNRILLRGQRHLFCVAAP